MKSTLLKVAVAFMFLVLAGCISVHEREPVATTTTTERVTTPHTTTVQRTTVY